MKVSARVTSNEHGRMCTSECSTMILLYMVSPEKYLLQIFLLFNGAIFTFLIRKIL